MAARFVPDTLFSVDLEKSNNSNNLNNASNLNSYLLLSIGTVKAHVPNNVVHKIQEQLRSFLLNR